MTVIVGSLVASSGVVGIASGAIAGTSIGFGMGAIGTAVGVCLKNNLLHASTIGTSAGAILGTASSIVPGGITISSTLGTILLGAENEPTQMYTFGCWKSILHDDSLEPSNGKLLKDVIIDERIKQVLIKPNDNSIYPDLTLENIWNETFRIEYVTLYDGQVAAHVVKI